MTWNTPSFHGTLSAVDTTPASPNVIGIACMNALRVDSTMMARGFVQPRDASRRKHKFTHVSHQRFAPLDADSGDLISLGGS